MVPITYTKQLNGTWKKIFSLNYFNCRRSLFRDPSCEIFTWIFGPLASLFFCNRNWNCNSFKVHWVIFKYNGNVRYRMIYFFLLLKLNVSRTDVIWECQKVFLVLSTVIFVPYYNRKYDHVSSGLGISNPTIYNIMR